MKGISPVTIKQYMTDEILNNSAKVITIDVSQEAPNGFFGLEFTLSGTGAPSINIGLTFSLSGKNYIAPTGMTVALVTGFLKTSGVGTNGKEIYDLTPYIPPCKEVRITITETATAAGTCNLWVLTA